MQTRTNIRGYCVHSLSQLTAKIRVNKGAIPRVYACNVCHTKHMKPTGAKCPFGPPQADESQETPAAQAAASQQVQSDILMSSATLSKFTDVLQVITTRLDVIETRLDNGGGR
jgi:hypothetical protein